MKIKALIFTVIAIGLFSCSGNAEYAYNEKVASLYFAVSNHVEELYKDLDNGKNLELKSVEMLKKNTADRITDMNDLQASDAAKDFQGKVNEYLNLVEGDISKTLESYASLDCDCPEKKDSIKSVANDLYNKLSNIENEMLDVQLKYMDKVGLEPEKK